MSCGVGCRCSADLVLLWLWHRLAAVVVISKIAREPTYNRLVTIKKKKNNK